MATNIVKVNIELSIDHLECPAGITHKFITYLAANSNRIAHNIAFCVYLKEEMEQAAQGFFIRREASPKEVEEVVAWIDGLSWREPGFLALAFCW